MRSLVDTSIRRAMTLACAAVLAGSPLMPLSAQQADSVWTRSSSPMLVKYGKWLTLAAAVGMGIKAADAHDNADRWFNRLERYCDVDPSRCDQTSNGSYIDPTAERYYQQSLHHDRVARRWLVGGEITLIGTAGLFVWELTRPKRLPENIPFEPEIRVSPHQTRFGFRVGF
jgi:hypothetical protein